MTGVNTEKRGMLVVVDGVDGSGISTFTEMLEEKLREKGFDVVVSKEPGRGTYAGDLIYGYIGGRFGPQTEPGSQPEVETILFAIDRYYQALSSPAWIKRLASGSIVLKDRYYYTSMVYQSYGFKRRDNITDLHALDEVLKWIRVVNAWMPPAHIVFYLKVDVKIAIARLVQNLVRVALGLYPLEETAELAKHAEWFYTRWLPRHPETGEGSDWYPHMWERYIPAALYPYRSPLICIVYEEERINPRDALKHAVDYATEIIKNVKGVTTCISEECEYTHGPIRCIGCVGKWK